MVETLDHVQLSMPRGGEELAPRRRFYGEDPFGNRVEFIEP